MATEKEDSKMNEKERKISRIEMGRDFSPKKDQACLGAKRQRKERRAMRGQDGISRRGQARRAGERDPSREQLDPRGRKGKQRRDGRGRILTKRVKSDIKGSAKRRDPTKGKKDRI